ncbi:MAG: hypothetical protein MK193_13905 [Lentisphaeria bacterium]|nr:hypothetical protein [Lentisphaeria bacterium]
MQELLYTLRLWPHHHMNTQLRDELLSMLDRNQGIVDTIWFCTPTHHVDIAEHHKSAQIMLEAAQLFREQNICVGIQVAYTLGHGDGLFAGKPDDLPWDTMHGQDGTVSKSCACPRDTSFHNYLTEMTSSYAVVKPDHMWIDDDLRLVQHSPITEACFCPRCIKQFSTEQQFAYTKASLLNALHQDQTVRAAWITFSSISLAMVAEACTHGMYKHFPDCLMGLQQCSHENDLLAGADYYHMYEAFSGPAKKAVVSRPGGGFYDDHSPRGMINKAIRISRQVARLPEYCSTACAEIENFPHHILGKTPRGTALESCLYLAHGIDSLSYAMICSSLESIDDYERHIEMLGDWKSFLRTMQHLMQGTTPAGVDPYFSRQHAIQKVSDGPEDFSWRRVYLQDVYGLAELGVPMAPDGTKSCCYILGPDAARGISQKELFELIQGGLVISAEAFEILHEKGYTNELGLHVQVHKGHTKEFFTNHELNGQYAHSFWQSYFGRSIPYEIHSDTGDALTCYEDTQTVSTLIHEPQIGGRIAIIGNGAWDLWANSAKQMQLHQMIDWCSKGAMPCVLKSAVQVHMVPRVNKEGKILTLFVMNITIDQSPIINILIRNAAGPRAELHRPETPTISVIGGNLNQQEDTIQVPPLAPWSVAFISFT